MKKFYFLLAGLLLISLLVSAQIKTDTIYSRNWVGYGFIQYTLKADQGSKFFFDFTNPPPAVCDSMSSLKNLPLHYGGANDIPYDEKVMKVFHFNDMQTPQFTAKTSVIEMNPDGNIHFSSNINFESGSYRGIITLVFYNENQAILFQVTQQMDISNGVIFLSTNNSYKDVAENYQKIRSITLMIRTSSVPQNSRRYQRFVLWPFF